MTNNGQNAAGQKDRIRGYFFWITLILELILLFVLALVIRKFIKESFDIFQAVGVSIIIIWIGILVLYFSWAIYFYNINMGLTDRDWAKMEDQKSQGIAVTEPDVNPQASESLGLPPGTVRGTIALTLLIGAMAIIIVMFGKKLPMRDNELFIDFFDFFKTAFLMMIAFYFGAKSLQYLSPPKNPPDPNKPGPPSGNPEGKV